jgi:hypothetical protein
MPKKARGQMELSLEVKKERNDSRDATNVVNVREYKIQAHTMKVLGKLREVGLVRSVGKAKS